MNKRRSNIMLSILSLSQLILLFMLLFIFSVSEVFAITGKIGNGRIVLNAEEGDIIEKSIKVINDNDVPLNISVFSGGNYSKNIKIYDENFILEAGEEKNARFSIKAASPGRYESKIFVQFSPLSENEAGVGLTSEIILIVKESESNLNGKKILIAVMLGFTLLLLTLLATLYSFSKSSRNFKGKIKEKNDSRKKREKKEINDKFTGIDGINEADVSRRKK